MHLFRCVIFVGRNGSRDAGDGVARGFPLFSSHDGCGESACPGPSKSLLVCFNGSGRSVAWLARLLGVQEVVSSNLTAPTIFLGRRRQGNHSCRFLPKMGGQGFVDHESRGPGISWQSFRISVHLDERGKLKHYAFAEMMGGAPVSTWGMRQRRHAEDDALAS